ncbi:EamA family transporter [Candidatus Woesearchaeota archaeon]|nr:EamA family transporter [Candidatus Woesearchaeota archaeon]
MNNLFIVIIGMIIVSFLGASGITLIKKGIPSKFSLKGFINEWIIYGVACYGISTIIFILIIKMADLSVVYPLTSLSYIFVILLAAKFLGEKINKHKWIAIMLIIIGNALISFG